MITLNLTDDQAEILGYALTKALRLERASADTAKRNSDHQRGARDRQYRIEELRCILDAA